MKITVKLKGGIGNQMFEYALGRALQLEHPDAHLVLDISEMHQNANRPFCLDIFHLPEDIEILQEDSYKKYSRAANPFLRIGMRFCPKLVHRFFAKKSVFLWDDLTYIQIPPLKQDSYFNGYWQCEKYFRNHRDQIKADFEFTMPLSDQTRTLASRIQQAESVCVHIRLGDYLNPENARYQVCTPAYYLEGMREIAKSHPECTFFIFSDEPEKACELLGTGHGLKLFCIPEGNTNYEDLYLMTLCRHFVMSNSSFSWWAQYLSDSGEKTVVAPKRWYTDYENKDIYLDSWKRI